MRTGPAGTRGVDEELVNLALISLAATLALSLLLRGAGTVAAVLTGTRHPAGGIGSGLRVLADPSHPDTVLDADGLSAGVYWAVVAISTAFLAALGWMSWQVIVRVRHRSARDPHRIAGTATRTDIDAVASRKALVRRGRTLRPSLPHPKAEDVGYLLGRSRGREIWASVEDSILIVGPPRSGKGLHLVINAILDAPGAVVTTSTRPDNITATLQARREYGPVAVFDPNNSPPDSPTSTRLGSAGHRSGDANNR